MTNTPIIKFKGVKKDFINDEIITSVLHGVDIDIHEGEFVSIMGPSGSGKSTMMHIMGFLDTLTAGEYFFKGKDVAGLKDDELALMRRDQAGFVFQFFNLLARQTVLENVMLPMLYAEVPVLERNARAKKALEKVGLGHRINFDANKISGGERQRVAIARALVNQPKVIFADEPTGNLDSKSGLEILKIFQDLNNEGKTIVMVTHEIEAAEFAKRIVAMKDGVIIKDSTEHPQRKGEFSK